MVQIIYVFRTKPDIFYSQKTKMMYPKVPHAAHPRREFWASPRCLFFLSFFLFSFIFCYLFLHFLKVEYFLNMNIFKFCFLIEYFSKIQKKIKICTIFELAYFFKLILFKFEQFIINTFIEKKFKKWHF
jgi:hypothetical protein